MPMNAELAVEGFLLLLGIFSSLLPMGFQSWRKRA